MPTNPNQSPDGYKIYRSNFLPSFSRPLVFITWDQYTYDGLSFLQIQSFTVHSTAPIQVEGISVDKRYLPRTEEIAYVIQTFTEIALDRAEDSLERLASQAVTLEEIDVEKFRIVAHREGFMGKWQELQNQTQSSSLQSLLYDMTHSQIHRIARFEAVKPT